MGLEGDGAFSHHHQMGEPMRYCGVNHVALVCRDMADPVEF
jgi:hypothetical protein